MATIKLPSLNVPAIGNYINSIKANGDVSVALALEQLQNALQQFSNSLSAGLTIATATTSAGGVTVQEVTLSTPTTTISPSVAASTGSVLFLVVTQDSTGGRLVTWGAALKNITPDDLNSQPSYVNYYLFIGRSDGNWYLASMMI
jgi:hypothetical protein